MRKLRRAAEAALDFVEVVFQFAQRGVERRRGQCRCRRRWRQRARERGAQRFTLFGDFGLLIAKRRGNLRQEFDEAGHAVTRGFRKIGAAEIRRLIGQQKHRQRPAAVALRQHGVCRLINLIEVGALFAVHFDVDEELVHERGDSGVLERFVHHHMAPVAGRVAHRQQDRFVLCARQIQRFFAPCVPVNGVVGVLLQIGAGFAGETVRHGCLLAGQRVAGLPEGRARSSPRRGIFSTVLAVGLTRPRGARA